MSNGDPIDLAPLPIVAVITLGVAGGSTPITANLTSDPAQWSATYDTLSENYVQQIPEGIDGGFPIGQPDLPYSGRGSYSSGQRVQFFAIEATAIVAAGAGVYS